ncbi:hypothetical protein HHK36_031333 [Tetracentron sinense]|uniref:Uncharacterized protein n=1 Tax=Tetracentron sinense TaxID=13715 RepID=A0A834YB14_TETSI|nr:hypothetical protein HHK36_031333 [Tetracentron sinense]
MTQIKLLSKTSKLFLNRSKTCVKILGGNLCKLSLFSFDCLRKPEDRRDGREDNEQILEKPTEHINEEEEEVEVKKRERDGIVEVGFENGSLRSSVKLELVLDDSAKEEGLRERELRLKAEPKQKLELVLDDSAKEEGLRERELRLKACTEAFGRLVEIEVKESSDLDQVVDLKEVLFCYSLIRNRFFVDLANQFIVDVGDGILKHSFTSIPPPSPRKRCLVLGSVMDNIVDSLNNAYQEFVAAAAGVLEANEISGIQKTAATDAALDNFKQQWELFRVASDQAEEFVESVKQRIGLECLVDEATGLVAGKPGQASTTGLPPISAVQLEQMSKAVRWLVIELQHGSRTPGAASHCHSSVPFDARFSEDAAQ